jgi:hypothetical protein
MTKKAPEAATPQGCPTCGALPCDQVKTPENPKIAPSVGFLAVIFGLLRSSERSTENVI